MRFTRRAALATAALLAVAAGSASAHGPTRQKVTETITINAAPDAVWAQVKDFGGFAKWHPAVEASPATDGNNLGSRRTLKLKGGGEVLEELETFSDADKRFSYRMKEAGPVPVTNYSSTLSVKAGEAAGTTLVEWRGAFYRGHPNNDPPPDKNDEAAVAAITGIYKAGLGNLKTLLEKR
ncbi:Polyketide cyclase / dehydrase and lipid transport [Burkholderiales bacterium JOSHI_001]|nr:Polyketide cyclase / dehydrase and lipid transport [Burkholderiales bacterium JOSHI_001]